MTIYDFDVKNIEGQTISMGDYRGKVLLIVNTASKCGFTPQYTGLEALYRKYKDRGFEVLGFPCNQFGSQEPGSGEEIKGFCALNFDTTFTLFEKIDVNGENAHPMYKYLRVEKGGLLGDRIKWNFTKFLVDQEGNVVKRFAPNVEPESMVSDIEMLL